MRKQALAVAFALAACAGCGGSRPFLAPLNVTGRAAIRFVRTPPPAATNGPGFGATHLAFLSPLVGFAATTGGGGYVQKVGYVPPSVPAEIDRTDDGGVTWHVVWRRTGTQLNWIQFADPRNGAAGGNVVRNRGGGIGPRGPSFLLLTSDGGRTWLRRAAPQWLSRTQPQLVAARFWVAGPYVTTDAGAHWLRHALPRGAAFTDFASPRVGYAAARGRGCVQQIWKTSDGGATWLPLAGTCARSYSSLDFLDERVGYAATGLRAYDLAAVSPELPVLVIRKTDDGGETWHIVYAIWSRFHTWPADTRLHFVDALRGWAVSSETDQGFTFDALHRTSDGGKTWTAVRYPALPSAFARDGAAWAGGSQGVWRTTDFGRSWRIAVRPQNVGPSQLLIATRSHLVLDSNVGVLRSNEAGDTWASTSLPSAREIAQSRGEPAYIRPARGESGHPVPVLIGHGTIRRPPRVRYDLGAVSFDDAEHGLIASGQQMGDDQPGRIPVFATADGGRTWRMVRLPRRLEENSAASIAHGAVVLVTPPVLYFSPDEGVHWRSARVRDDFWDCGVQRPSRDVIWVLCSLSVTRGPTVLFRSDDRGHGWRRFTGSVWLDTRFVALDEREAWTEGKSSAHALGVGGSLWHTRDGGRSWREVWPRVVPDALVRDYRFFGPHLLSPAR